MSIFETEVHEQPVIVRKLLETESEHAARLVKELGGRFEYVVIAARGTSDNAARYAQYLFGAHNQWPVALTTPSLFTLYQRPPKLAGALVVGISQSGQSPDIVEVIAEGRRQGRPTLAITNAAQSPLARTADYHLDIHSGPERAVAATKTYTASLAALALLSTAFSGNEDHRAQLEQVPNFMQQALTSLSHIPQRAERYRYMDHCAVIGRGFNYATAFEIALKVKEMNRIITEPYSSADFRHGPIAVVKEDFPVIIIAPHGAAAEDIRLLTEDLRKLGAELLVISEDGNLLSMAHLPMPLPDGLPEWLTPLVAVMAGQLFSLGMAQAKGLDPDRPVGLKKVTETR
jgi:glucosamine--fructose-6-phosphate aminotransferase (isomerizing)